MFGYMVCKRSGDSHNRIIVKSMRLFEDWIDVIQYLKKQERGDYYDVYTLGSSGSPTKVHYQEVREAVRGVV